ncbi:MAG TPA: DUF2889 domain-containing protein [Candidatus Cybelea sp.]|nr:DUF2889 domain-containing protein [Candidatus Cybelea sp.]
MPLSPPASRRHVHTRFLEIKGYGRDDGLWDIEGHLTETPYQDGKPDDHPMHEMWLRLTVDEELLVHRSEASTVHGPYRICPDAARNFTRLAGLRIGQGWTKAARERVGGVHGCTHLVEMLGQMATAAMQTLWPVQEAKRKRVAGGELTPSLGVLDSCMAYDTSGPMVKELYPRYYTGK